MAKNSNDTLKYAGMATQWLVTLGVAVWLGWLVDAKLKWKFPICVIVFPLVALVGLFWLLMKDLNDPKK